MTNIAPSEFIEADYQKFSKQNGEFFVKVTTNNALITDKYDYIAMTYPTTTTDVFTYKQGGASGTVVGIITITYTNSSKTTIASVART